MFALIKKEIEDSIVFFMLTAFFIVMLISSLIYRVWLGGVDHVLGVPAIMYKTFVSFPFLFLPLFAVVFGASQMYSDRDKKISAFLATLATTRKQILAAKIMTGISWILLVILPVAVTNAILLKVFAVTPIPDASFLRDMFVTIFLCSLACYAFGLQIGWCEKKLMPVLGVIFIVPVLLSLIIIKGIGFEVWVILSLFIIAAMVRTWQKFMSTSL